MNDEYNPTKWLSEWPLDEISLKDAWCSVHLRFGFAAEKGNELETALIMLVSQAQQIEEKKLSFDDLIEMLDKNGGLTLGRLISLFENIYSIPSDSELSQELDKAKRSRNYLIHHFYRHNSDKFKTPNGCKELVNELSTLQDNIEVAREYLENWRDSNFGSRPLDEILDSIRKNPDRWLKENEAMLRAIVGDKNINLTNS